ncbi:MAG: hypothetical protein RI990_888 [Planctomycetota bacterium]
MNIRSIAALLATAAVTSSLPAVAQLAPGNGISEGSTGLGAADGIATAPNSLTRILAAAERFRAERLGNDVMVEGAQAACVFGRLGTGATPADSAADFLKRHAAGLYGIDPADLLPFGPYETGEHVVPVMPDREVGGHKFTMLAFTQARKGIPVYRGNLLVLTRNIDGFPAVLASSTLWDVSAVDAQLARIDTGRLPDARVWTRHALNQFRQRPDVGPAQYVIWAGVDRIPEAPRLAVRFEATGGGHWDPENYTRIEYVVDAETGAILHQESMIRHADVNVAVQGLATTGNRAAECTTEVGTGLPYARVTVGSTDYFADADGNVTIPNGSSSISVTSTPAGRWFAMNDALDGSIGTLTLSSSGGPLTFLHNAANTDEGMRAEVNAYLHANIVRDLLLDSAPSFPTIPNQQSFQINVRVSGSCNAFYDGSSINFYPAGGGCNNTAFSTVVHHEYGHHIVNRAGSAQGAYGEGFSDVMGVLVTDESALGVGFQSCASGIRNAANTCQYDPANCSSCGSAIHSCGQLISGCVWDLRNRLLAKYPSTYRQVLADLAVNSSLLHGPVSTITPAITVHFLTLDDDDADLSNGSPNYMQINDAFSVHNMPGPTVPPIRFTFPDGLPTLSDPAGATLIGFRVDSVLEDVNPSTVRMFVRGSAAQNFTTLIPSPQSDGSFVVALPPAACPDVLSFYFQASSTSGTILRSPSSAPTLLHQATVGSDASELQVAADDFEGASSAWTVGAPGDNATSGIWQRVDPVGTFSGAIPAQPEDDRTAAPGTTCWITGQGTAGGTLGAADVDGGVTTLTSPDFDTSGLVDPRFSYWRWYSNEAGAAPNADSMPVELSVDGGNTWVLVEDVSENARQWVFASFRVADFTTPTDRLRIRFLARDLGSGSLVEAGVDDVRVSGFEVDCVPTRRADLNGDGRVDGADLGIMLGRWGVNDPVVDLNGDGLVDGLDLGLLIADWG